MSATEPSPLERPDPAIWLLPEMRGAVSVRNICRIYLILRREGLPQSEIAALTRQSEREVAAILAGRKVLAYDVQHRIANGLGIPLCVAGLASCSTPCPPAHNVPVAKPGKNLPGEYPDVT